MSNVIRPGEGGWKVPALISIFENFLVIQTIPTKLCHFYYNLLENKIPEFLFVKDIRCCHGNQTFDAMFSLIFTFLIFFLLTMFFKTNANSLSQSQEIDIFS